MSAWRAAVRRTAFAILGLAAAGPAAAAPACSTRADVLAQLAAKYREAPTQHGLAANGGLLELLTSAGGATWTIIVSMPDGTSCLLAAGQVWSAAPAAPAVPDPGAGQPL